MPPNGEVYGITDGITGPLRMRVGRSYATEREVYGKRATNGRPYEMRGKRGKCVGAVIGSPSGKCMG